ncbi:DUF84 family protein [Candidatus Bathyarchaeota archaeon]|nr:DUF84 family protein [Candidatus Bathyarchaeota archaeon]
MSSYPLARARLEFSSSTRAGAIGIFTKGKVTRKELYKHGIFMALAKFFSPKISRK